MTFRPLTVANIEAARVFWSTIQGLRLTSADEAGPLAGFFERNPDLSWGAFDRERLVATVLAGHDGRRGFLYHLAVDAACRGQGLSSELMRRALAGLAQCKIGKVHVFVLADNPGGLSFWAGAARDGWARREDVLVFSRDNRQSTNA